MSTTLDPRRAERRDTPHGRFYQVAGLVSPLTGSDLFPSVTHLLSVIGKPALVRWSANLERALCVETAADLYADLAKLPKPMSRETYIAQFGTRLTHVKAHQRETERACAIGTQAHALCEWALRKSLGQVVGPEPKVRDEALWAWMAWSDWQREHDLRPLAIEDRVWHRRLGYAGTLDLLATVDGELAVLDFKTSKAVYGEAHLQNAMYQDAVIEMGHGRPAAGYIVRLPKVDTDPAVEVVRCPPRLELMPVARAVCRLWMWWHAEEVRSRAAWEAKREAAHVQS